MTKTYAFIIAANVPVGAEVGTGYSGQYLKNHLECPADLVQIACNNQHIRFEWRASTKRTVKEKDRRKTNDY